MTRAEKPIAFITGATGGIGLDAARYFDSKGYRLWLSGRNPALLNALGAQFSDPILTLVDLADPAALEALCVEIEDGPTRVAVALINAGVIAPGAVINVTRAQLDSQIDINLRAAMHLTHAFARRMARDKVGHIVNMISAAAFVSLKGSAAYSATKFGMRGFVIGLAEEMQGSGVAITGIYPGAVDTPMLHHEARHGGSALNFLQDPISTAEVIAVLDQALKEKKEHYIVPKRDALSCMLVNAFPGMLRKNYPKWERQGEAGRQRFLAKIGG